MRIEAADSASLRSGEISNLTFSDIDFEASTINIRTKEQTEDSWAWQPKGGRDRQVPLSAKLHNLLLQRMMELSEGFPYTFLSEKRYWTLRGRIGRINERVRCRPDENWTRPFKRILEKAGIKKGKFHDLCKTFLTRWLKSMPYQELHRLAGHSDIQTTLTYYTAVGSDYIDRARAIGATGLEPATS